MELQEVVVIEMPSVVRNPITAKPCCFICFELEIPQKKFGIHELECKCKFFLHDVCVQEWFRIAGRSICPQCGSLWKVKTPCLCKIWMYNNPLTILLLVALLFLGAIGLYLLILSFTLRS